MKLRHKSQKLNSKLVNDSMYITLIDEGKKMFACSSCNYISDRLYHTRMHIERIHVKHGHPMKNKRKYKKDENVKKGNPKKKSSGFHDVNINNLFVFSDSHVLKSESYIEKYQELSIAKNTMYVENYNEYVVEEDEMAKQNIASSIYEDKHTDFCPEDIEIFNFSNNLLGYNVKDRKNGLSGMYSYHV